MSKTARVVWTEGMFLRPHHFQQAENYQLNQQRIRGEAQHSWNYGFYTLKFDEEQLKRGTLALDTVCGVFPDGTLFSLERGQAAPAPVVIAPQHLGQQLVLALPAQRGGRDEVIFSEQKESLARYVSFEQEVADHNEMSLGDATVQFGQLRMRIMLESELTAEWVSLPLAKVTDLTKEKHLVFHGEYIPPCLHQGAVEKLHDFVNNLLKLMAARNEAIAFKLREAGRMTNNDTLDFMLLAFMNRARAEFTHLAERKKLHPEVVYGYLCGLAGELMTWSESRLLKSGLLPPYNHDDLAGCFGRVAWLLQQQLSQVIEQDALAIELDNRSHGLYSGYIPDSPAIRKGNFVLGVKSSQPNANLATQFPARSKVASVHKIRDLVQLQLPGIALHVMPSSPPQIPWNAGYTYFQLEQGGDLWDDLEQTGAIALHLAGQNGDLEIQLWSIRATSA